MATETLPRNLEADNSEALINAQLKRTRSQVKSVEFGQRVLKLVVGVLVFFLLATLLDHWVVGDGLPIWARVILWVSLIAGILWYSVRSLLPLILYRVNPLYAARTIEETKPSLKNSLINYLTLRPEQDRLPTVIYDAIAKQAARGVKDASVDHAVDHAPLIRWGYLLLGLTFCFALYFVLSPKNPFRTVARVVIPWADLSVPSRVQIVEVTPGSAQLYRGKTVKVSARIEGLAEEETATLHYTTADGQQREQPINLKLDELHNYTTVLPVPSEKQPGLAAGPRELAGLQQDFEYYITAGDARTKTFKVQVAPAPYIGVERIEYKYPAYTKKPPETRQGEVNVEALEGTIVTIHGTANQPLKKAWIELRDNAGKLATLSDMKITDQMTSGSWTLGWKDPSSRDLPDYASYALRFHNQQGHDNPEPIAYPVKVVRDDPPTIDILAPSSTDISVPWDQPITFEVRAQDPDFGLIEVQLNGMRGDKNVFKHNIASYAAANAHQGNLQQKFTKSPKDLHLQVGDVIEYHMTATDNKVPNPNIALTAPRRLRVIEAQKNRKPDNSPLAKNNPPQKNQNPPQDKNGQRDPNQAPQQNDQQPQNDPANPMGNQGQPNQDQQNNNGKGNPQEARDPTQQNQDQNKEPQNSNDPRQQQNGNNGAQNTPNKEQNPKDPPQNQNEKQQPNGGEPNNGGGQQNKPNQKNQNDPSQGNKPGDQQPAGGQQSNETKNNSEQNPMGGGAQNQPQNGNQDNEQQNGKQNPQSGDQNGKPEQNQAKGRPQENDNKLNSDGSQDADAIQRAHEHLKKEFEKKPEQKQNDQVAQNQPQNGGDKKNQNNQPQTGKPEQGKPEEGKQEQGKPEAGNQNNPGQENAGQKPSQDQAGNQEGKKPENGKQETGKPDEGKQPNDKQGGKQEGAGSTSKEQNQQNTGNNKSDDQGKQGGTKNDTGKAPSPNDEKQPGENKNGGEQDPNGAKQSEQKQTGEQSPNGAGQKPDPTKPQQQQPGQGDKSGDQQASKTGEGEKPEAGAKADQGKQAEQNGKKPGDMKPDGNRDSQEKKTPGANDKPSNQQENKPGNATEPENKQNPKNDQQQSGGGNPNGSPKPQETGKPNANPSNSSTNKNDDQNKEQSPSNKANDSSSQSDEGGDKNGGGKPGGGQQENKQGRGASGSNTSDEKGANASKEEGDGETGSTAGKNNKEKSNDKTGKSGNEAGNGTEKKQGDGQQPGGQAGENAAEGKNENPGNEQGEPGGQASPQTGLPKEGKTKDGPAGNTPGGGGGKPGSAIPPEYNGQHATSPADPINDAYAKQATDLVLDQLQKQLRTGNVDPELRKKLGGWDNQKLQEFIDRNRATLREAELPGPAGDAALNKIRSLGLRPEQSSNAGDNAADDSQRGNRVNRRSAPPSEYRDIYRAFQKGASGG